MGSPFFRVQPIAGSKNPFHGGGAFGTGRTALDAARAAVEQCFNEATGKTIPDGRESGKGVYKMPDPAGRNEGNGGKYRERRHSRGKLFLDRGRGTGYVLLTFFQEIPHG